MRSVPKNQLLAYGAAHGGGGLLVGVCVEQVAPVRVAHMHVQHGGTRIQAGLGGVGQRLGRDRQGGVQGAGVL